MRRVGGRLSMTAGPSVAIVGIGGIFPDAPDLSRFWDNIRAGRSAAREVPAGRWHLPADAVFDPEPGSPDRVYSRSGCFIEALPPLTELAGLDLDPALLAGLDPLFHLLLHAGHRAFADAVTAPVDRARIGVIVGNLALPSETSSLLAQRLLGRTFAEQLLGRGLDHPAVEPLNRYVAGLPAGILAHALGIGGGSFTLDAACASSLYAIKLAADELLAGRADAMLTGGVSRPDPLYTQMGFSQLRALSRRGICSPFDAAGDGLVVGEGAGIFVLKRTEDALAHGDRIYGIIRGIGLANDVGGSLLAPLAEGQLRAMRAAYARAGWEPRDVDLIECHATGTPVGDATEFASLRELWGESRPEGARCVIGSVKSNIGHLLTAAGAAALTKVLLALREETLPPTASFNAPPPGIGLDASPFRVLKNPLPWSRHPGGAPRRAAVSAFGFGGINAHLLIEEWQPERVSPRQRRGTAGQPPASPPPIAVVGLDARFGPWESLRSYQERVLGGDPAAAPTPPRDWWGAEESPWFRGEGLHETPFAGFYRDEVTVATDAFRIPPREMEEMLPQQLLMLQAAAGAMADAGLNRAGNEDAGVFIGIALDLNATNFSFRWSLADKAAGWGKELGADLSPAELTAWSDSLRDAAGPPLTANRTMGALGSVVASRIAREFRVGGPSFTISGEESSGIRALETAVRLLQGGELERALVGAVDLAGDLRAVLGHHAGRPFSPTGRALTFDVRADGSIVGEGAAAVVLKRLADAERDGDRIYAVIRGIGSACGETPVPGPSSYQRALERAYAEARVDPASIDYLEAGGSGHPAEDRLEAVALAAFFGKKGPVGNGEAGAPRLPVERQLAIASVKGEIGHCGAASGLASFVRGCLALYQEIIPPCRAVETPLAELDAGPFYFPRTPRYWLRNRADGPRRAGISGFGVDGNCTHVVLEGRDTDTPRTAMERIAPAGTGGESLFALAGETPEKLAGELALLRQDAVRAAGGELAPLAREWHARLAAAAGKPLALAAVARNREELLTLLGQGERLLAAGCASSDPLPPQLRDRLFYSPAPLGRGGKVAFVFPGSGNHYPGMGVELSARWPETFRRQDAENLRLRDQFCPELFWNGAPQAALDDDHRAVIFGQVALGTAVSDLVRSFGVQPQAVIGYSLGESAGLFALRAWRDRDAMLARMHSSTLFTRDLAGECRAARRAWGISAAEAVTWSLGVVSAPAHDVRQALRELPRVYLLIVNTPDECVVGGDAAGVGRLVATLGTRFHPLCGVTTVHCEVAREVAAPYRELHLFATTPPPGIDFYSGARGAAYKVNRESAADAILAQAVEGIDFPTVVEAAYADDVRLFLEMGPGGSCSRMIGRILDGRPHLARSVCHTGQEPAAALLRLLAQLVAERVAVDLAPLFDTPPVELAADGAGSAGVVRVRIGGTPFAPPEPPRHAVAPPLAEPLTSTQQVPAGEESLAPLVREFAATQEARLKAHEAYLGVADQLARTMGETLALQQSLLESLAEGGEIPPDLAEATQVSSLPPSSPLPKGESQVETPAKGHAVAYDREMCLEFARGKVAAMLGPAFAEADSFPTRVRLPDEPLMLVDRIVTVEGEAQSMTSGRVVTEHGIVPGAWYLDGGRIPTCIAVEAGQADLFLSGYLGIDFITRGLAVYRLLDATVTFHRELPLPGETIRYDIRIERFFRQGETHLFRFLFDATVDGEPLLTMRDGCAGFFTAQELAAGKGIVRPAIDLRPRSGSRPADWEELAPPAAATYNAGQLDRLRAGDLAGCFGPLFAGLPVPSPLTIPGGRMRLVHRVTELSPAGGRYGLGLIRAEADISPDDWFLTCHFVDDRVMPGTLMYECCMHTLRIFLLRMGWVAAADRAAWQPVPGVQSQLRCRGQVLETTKTAAYEVSIREQGYRPEPYAIVDALMYADGKPIVEITGMSVRLTGTTKEQLSDLWHRQRSGPPAPGNLPLIPFSSPAPGVRPGRGDAGPASSADIRKPAIYTKEQILAYSNGNPSVAFGEPYRVFDRDRKIARLPGPPYQFMDRITAVRGEPWRMAAGAMAEAQYDIPADAWYFAADRQPRMPFAVLLEAALQPCGWLAAYVGSALTSPTDLSFRNLGGNALQHRPVTPASGTLTATATLTKVATSGGMIIQEFAFAVADRHGPLYTGETMFGFFSREALATQVGIRDANPYRPTAGESERGRNLPFPLEAPFPEKRLRMIDRIALFVPDGGPAGLGYLRGEKEVDPDEWFFAAHFYQDPVTPGSLGLEAFLQLVKYAAVERWGWRPGNVLAAVALERSHRWLYRGQIVPASRLVTVEAWITACDEGKKVLTADGFLAVDGRPIYQMHDFTVRME
jgi:acyl transferase domain-containing protein/3-hydroxymyristoyl/3-hydroxydecanoyl-(acyl carrier protein) dehydratase